MSLSTSLVELWKLDEASGNASGAVNSLTLTDTGTVGSGTGVISNCRTFNGSSQYLSRASDSNTQTGDIDFSIAGWIYVNSLSSLRVACKGELGVSIEWNLRFESGAFKFLVGSSSDAVFGSLTSGVWYHVACVHDSVNNTITVYVNGVSGTPVSYSSGATAGSGDFILGGDIQSGTRHYFDGKIDEFAFWKKAITATEIGDMYNDGYGLAYTDWGKPDSPSAELTTNLNGYWSMEGTSGGSEADQTANGNTLTNNGTVGSTAGKVANCRTFGTSNYLSHASNTSLQTGDITFAGACWVYVTNKSSDRAIHTKAIVTNSREYRVKYNSSADRFTFDVWDSSNNSGSVNADALGSPSTNTWYFLVWWHDATKDVINITVNAGTVNSTAWTTGLPAGSDNMYVGFYSGGGNYFLGNLDEFGFWKRRLYPWERRYLYNSGSGRAYSDFAGSAAVNSVPWQRRHRRIRNLLRM